MDEYWKSKSIDIGKVKADTKVLVDFEYTEGMPDFKSISLSCGCTTVEKMDQNKLTVKLHVKPFPPHLHGKNESPIHKTIRIIYKNGGDDILTITGTRIR